MNYRAMSMHVFLGFRSIQTSHQHGFISLASQFPYKRVSLQPIKLINPKMIFLFKNFSRTRKGSNIQCIQYDWFELRIGIYHLFFCREINAPWCKMFRREWNGAVCGWSDSGIGRGSRSKSSQFLSKSIARKIKRFFSCLQLTSTAPSYRTILRYLSAIYPALYQALVNNTEKKLQVCCLLEFSFRISQFPYL